ncbi:MAG: hypothetical protein F4X54_00825 [Chloroflexi bacterium]|nr:hypothetical protein [Chloroflexota bacterium]MYB83293.1 hypothetical protein [Chloroflexota bacterium]
MTHPFHPLHGREFDLVEIVAASGIRRVFYADDGGTLRTIRQAFTSLALVDPFARVAAGRSAFRVQDLLELAAFLDSLDGDDGTAPEGEGGARSVKGILRDV